jgi:hypothetical protein
MTQGPRGGQSAPVTTGYDSDGAGKTATNESGLGGGTPNGSPSPTNPTSSTPWGSTSAGGNSGYGSGPNWSSAPLPPGYADAPTGAVPLVPGSSAQRTSTAPPPPAAAAGSSGRSAASHSARNRGPRRARLQLRHINPWTVLKFSCVLSIALFFVWLIVIGVLFGVLDGAGVIDKINETYTTIQGGSAKAPVTAGVVFGSAAIIGVVNIVLFIALSTVGSVVYNLCADLVGGVEITLSER